MATFNLNDKVRTFYGEDNETYRQRLEQGKARIVKKQDWRGTSYYYQENGNAALYHVNGTQAKKYYQTPTPENNANFRSNGKIW